MSLTLFNTVFFHLEILTSSVAVLREVNSEFLINSASVIVRNYLAVIAIIFGFSESAL